MFTVCPKCTLTLALTTADLRMGQGYVRCGRCANVFNALLALSEEPVDEANAPSVREQADPASASQILAAQFEEMSESEPSAPAASDDEFVELADEAVLADEVGPADEAGLAEEFEGLGDESAQPLDAPAPESDVLTGSPTPAPRTSAEPSDEGAIENESNYAEGTGTFETIVLEGDTITQTEEYVPEESVDSEIAALTERLGRTGNQHVLTPDALAAQFAPAASDSPPRSQSHWIVLCALMGLLLAAQAIHHWRERLAVSPFWNGPLTRLYAALGLPLNPHWNLAEYDVRQLGASSDPADSQIIRVHMSLANHATRAQPVPLLRVTLLDRYGKRLAMRALTPSEYWPPGQPARAFLDRDERVESEIAVRDPNAASASFELDVCLRESNGALRCAADTAALNAPMPMLAP
jgi:predicted Zn finger-like uncharacterized protein